MIEENKIAWKTLRQDYMDVVSNNTNWEAEWLKERELVILVDRSHYGDIYAVRMSFVGSAPQGITTFEACTHGDCSQIMARHYGSYQLKPITGKKRLMEYFNILDYVKTMVNNSPYIERNRGNIITIRADGNVTVQ